MSVLSPDTSCAAPSSPIELSFGLGKLKLTPKFHFASASGASGLARQLGFQLYLMATLEFDKGSKWHYEAIIPDIFDKSPSSWQMKFESDPMALQEFLGFAALFKDASLTLGDNPPPMITGALNINFSSNKISYAFVVKDRGGFPIQNLMPLPKVCRMQFQS